MFCFWDHLFQLLTCLLIREYCNMLNSISIPSLYLSRPNTLTTLGGKKLLNLFSASLALAFLSSSVRCDDSLKNTVSLK